MGQLCGTQSSRSSGIPKFYVITCCYNGLERLNLSEDGEI